MPFRYLSFSTQVVQALNQVLDGPDSIESLVEPAFQLFLLLRHISPTLSREVFGKCVRLVRLVLLEVEAGSTVESLKGVMRACRVRADVEFFAFAEAAAATFDQR